MVQGVQFRRGTTAEHSVFTGQSGEITVDTDKNVSVIHDGATVGGHPLVGTSTTQRITNKDINGTNINVSGVSTLSGGVQGTMKTLYPSFGIVENDLCDQYSKINDLVLLVSEKLPDISDNLLKLIR